MTRRNLILVIAGPSVPAPREEGACINEPIEERLHGLERETRKHEEKVQKKVSRDFQGSKVFKDCMHEPCGVSLQHLSAMYIAQILY